MTENREGFDLNRLDQQIEYPASSLDAQASQLVNDLHEMYRASPGESHANAESLRRVQQRLQTRFAPAHQETKLVSLRALPTRQERKSFMQKQNSERKSGWKRVSRTFNTLAAVLVVAILIGSAVTLVNLKNHTRSTQTGSSVVATATPKIQPSHDCAHVFRENGLDYSQIDPARFTKTNNGEHAVCLQGLETALHGTKEVNGHPVTLISAYADANQVLLKYAVGDYQSATNVPAASLNLQNGAELLMKGEYTYYDAQQQQEIVLSSYDTQKVPAGTTSLKLVATVSGFTADGLGSVSSSGSATFYFPVPFNTEERVATPNKAVQINGYTFTLDRVVVTPSETIVHVQVAPKMTLSDAGIVVEEMDGKSVMMVSDDPSGQNGKGSSTTAFYGSEEEDFMNMQGTWTLNLQGFVRTPGVSAASTPLGNAGGSIQFTVPPVA